VWREGYDWKDGFTHFEGAAMMPVSRFATKALVCVSQLVGERQVWREGYNWKDGFTYVKGRLEELAQDRYLSAYDWERGGSVREKNMQVRALSSCCMRDQVIQSASLMAVDHGDYLCAYDWERGGSVREKNMQVKGGVMMRVAVIIDGDGGKGL
jgi:hypothetical protein